MMDLAHQAVERVIRDSYSRLLAFVASRTGDIASAEDAFSGAILLALERWPTEGIPKQPEAWLLTVARRKLIDQVRRADSQIQQGIDLALVAAKPEATESFPDERLRLLFACAHPAIDQAMHSPLMLQAVLGLDAAKIARAFLISPATMSQRLVRAKTKIRDAKIRMERPPDDQWPNRLPAVLEAIYTAFTCGWELSGNSPSQHGLAEEAIWLGRVLVGLLPEEPEVLGLLALMLHSHARRRARSTPDGKYVPLSEQDTAQWIHSEIDEAEQFLGLAATKGRFGRFQLEAAIQSAHNARRVFGRVDWPTVALLYEGLVQVEPSTGALVGRAIAIGEAFDAARGFACLQEINPERVKSYQPYWAVRGHLLAQLDRPAEARHAFSLALGLTDDPAVRAFLLDRQRRC